MNCLVTGAAGFIGSTLCDKLLSLGYKVTGIDMFLDYYSKDLKLQNIKKALSHKNFSFIEGDLLNVNIISLIKDIEVVFHQAGQAGVRASWGDYFKTYIDHNILATQKVLEAIKSVNCVKKMVFASSSSVYGDAESYPTSENALPKPVSPYGVTKLAAENLVTLYSTQFGLPTVSLRYFTVYGPRQRPDMAFTKFCKSALKGDPITIFGDGNQSRDFTYVTDIVAANLLAADHGCDGAVYNIGGGTNATVNQVLSMITESVGPIKVNYSERVKGEARITSADTTNAKRDLKFVPAVSLQEGINNQLDWMRDLLRSDLVHLLE